MAYLYSFLYNPGVKEAVWTLHREDSFTAAARLCSSLLHRHKTEVWSQLSAIICPSYIIHLQLFCFNRFLSPFRRCHILMTCSCHNSLSLPVTPATLKANSSTVSPPLAESPLRLWALSPLPLAEASLSLSTHADSFSFPNPLHPSWVSQVYSNSWTETGSHTSLRPVLILRCWSWRLKSMIESERNLSVRLQGTHTQPEASQTLFTF